jgi:hypothetical protein
MNEDSISKRVINTSTSYIAKAKLISYYFVQTRSHWVMFIGDKGTGFGSRINGHMKYGGKWKEEAHSQDTNVVITNEGFTPKLYSFCCQYPNHPLQKKSNNTMVKPKSSSLCKNLDCILYKHHQSANARDSLSVLSIAIVGATSVLFNAHLYPYTSNPSSPNTGTINLNFILPR